MMITSTMTTLADEPQRLPSLFDLPEGVDVSVDDCEHPCAHCGTMIGFNTVLRARGGGATLTCGDCMAQYHRNGSLDKECLETVKVETAADTVRKIIPALYLSTDPNRLPYKERQLVLAWEAKEKAKGLWLYGETRRGKTRCICLLVERLIKEGRKVRAFFHGSFGDELVEVMRSEKSFRAWKYGITRVDVLVIDDLFAFKMTERVEAAIFEIIDERLSYYRPTFVTTQITKEGAMSRFSSKQRHAAFFARIKEFFTIIPFKRDEQAALGVGR